MSANVLSELLKAKAEITPKEKLFLRYYRKSGNAAWAAERAGYNDATEGGRILEKPAVRGYLACQTVDRSAHRPITYRDMIFLHEKGMEEVKRVFKDPGSSLKDKAIALEVAGRAVERVAKTEGLLSDKSGMVVGIGYDGNGQPKVNVAVDLTRLSLEELEKYRDLMAKLEVEGEKDETDPAYRPTWPEDETAPVDAGGAEVGEEGVGEDHHGVVVNADFRVMNPTVTVEPGVKEEKRETDAVPAAANDR
jgi:hypothetical protein